LKFDEEDDRPSSILIRPTMSYTMDEDGSIDEIVKREDIFPQSEKSETKAESNLRKLSDKIEEVSN
jgi:hypothetical protein